MKTDYKWVIGRYTGETAKEIKGLADSGVGYFQLEYGIDKRQAFVVVAFPFVADEDGIPNHLKEISDQRKLLKLEKDRCVRRNAHRPIEDETTKKSLCHSCGQK